ncbi:MAG: hypothetical protein WAM39_04825 [Bryobacteraceae bacterium]
MTPHDPEEKDGLEDEKPLEEGKPLISYRGAMAAYAVLAVVCLMTLHGDALYIALLIIGAIAIKTWLAEAKKRIE